MKEKTDEYQVVHCNIYDPRVPSVFKAKANERAQCTVIRCSLAKCPIRDRGECTWVGILSRHRCPYGKMSIEEGFTKRAGKCGAWVRERKERYEGVPSLGYPGKKMAFVGDYVYLPYPHAAMNETLPWLAPGGAFLSENPFLPKSSWSVATVKSIIVFRPHAMIGGEIKSYQKEEMPKFLLHLRKEDPSMWKELCKERPDLDKMPDHVGRMALLRTLRAPIEFGPDDSRYPVEWRWTGKQVITSSKDAYDKTWGGVKLESLKLMGVPAKDAAIKVEDNEWVTEKTVFVD